jgi:NAD(P)-dependent dehydrogenase (short-subunit alcohol dehydrogenase family)
VNLGLEGRVALVTGSARGIGRAVARVFAGEGARVALTYRSSRPDAEAAVAEIVAEGAEAMALHLDLASTQSIQGAVAMVTHRWGRVDILVNNAVDWPGDALPPARFEQCAAEDWQRLVSTNIHGAMAAVQAVLPSMRRAAWGRIVNISSIAADEGMPGSGWYAVAKASYVGLTRTLSAEVSGEGILTNTVMPGPTLTERIRSKYPGERLDSWGASRTLRRMPDPAEVASLVVYLCSAKNTAVTGETIRTGGHRC